MFWPLAAAVCPQPVKLVPQTGSEYFFSNNYTDYSASLLSGAIKIPTESFDDMALDPRADSRFQSLSRLNKYLEEAFPIASRSLEYINTYAMLYTFEPFDDKLAPILLTGHLDTVPVNNDTLDQWEYDPFEGYFDGEWIHGRGSVDDKNTVVAILEAIEHLLEIGWKPQRKLILAFGFDEEIGGSRGAASLLTVLLDRYGHNGFEFVMDEGSGQPEIDGVQIVGPFIAERGSLNTKISVFTPGGNSAHPPEHNGISYLTQIIESLESNPYSPAISDWKTHPAAHLYRCIAENTEAIPNTLRNKFLNLDKKSNLQALVDYIAERTNWMVWTSQAIDIVRAGVKINVLPEAIELITNYRVSIESSPEEVFNHTSDILNQISIKNGLSFYRENILWHNGSADVGALKLEAISSIPVAPITSYKGKQWEVLGGIMRHVFEDLVPSDTPTVIAPGIMSGNTDTSHYWDLTENIYRYSPANLKDSLNKHTINERLRFRAHLGSIAFYHQLLLNYDKDYPFLQPREV